jgi:hypothetical protein
MSGCPRKSICRFYLHGDPLPSYSYGILRRFYCDNAPQLCEIRKWVERGHSIPLGMFPDGTVQAGWGWRDGQGAKTGRIPKNLDK